MLKLMKYEFRKQAFSKLVILALVGLLELVFFYGVLTSSEDIIAMTMSLLFIFSMGALFFLAFESILTYSNDLKLKSSYMLFLTPNTSYSIVGAKVLSAGIQIILAGIAFFAVFVFNGGILIAKYDALAQFKETLIRLMDQIFQLKINLSDIISVLTVIIMNWINTITLAFFSITLSTTFLADKKYKGVVSFLIFIALSVITSKITSLIVGDNGINFNSISTTLIAASIITLFFTVLTYIGTAWMLDKKVSV
jgi:hypothetical protein